MNPTGQALTRVKKNSDLDDLCKESIGSKTLNGIEIVQRVFQNTEIQNLDLSSDEDLIFFLPEGITPPLDDK